MRYVLEKYNDGKWDRCHRSSRVVKDFVGNDIWEFFFTFAIVRNPFSRMVSWFNNVWEDISRIEDSGRNLPDKFKKFKRDAPTFRDFILNAEVFDREECENFYYKQSQTDFLSDSTGLNMDYIAHLESIEDDWKHIAKKANLYYVEIPHLNQSSGDKNYQKWYDDELRQVMFRRFKDDFETFGYRF